MPGGTIITRDAYVPQAPQGAYASVLEPLASAFATAGYKIRDHDAERTVFEHRFMPSGARTLAILVLLIAILSQSTGPSKPGAIVAGWVAIGALALYRH